jgi:hypothetical protein
MRPSRRTASCLYQDQWAEPPEAPPPDEPPLDPPALEPPDEDPEPAEPPALPPAPDESANNVSFRRWFRRTGRSLERGHKIVQVVRNWTGQKHETSPATK